MYKCIIGVSGFIPYQPPSETLENINIYTISLKTHLFFVHIAESQFFSKNLLTILEKYGIIDTTKREGKPRKKPMRGEP